MEWTQAFGSIPLDAPDTAPAPVAAAGRWPQSVAEFESVVDTFQHELVRFAFCRVRNLADAEDVVQDVLLRVYKDRRKHQAELALRPYLYRMVSNRCTDLLRKRKRTEAPAEDPVQTPGSEPSTATARLGEIEALLARLPARQAEVLRLRVYAGLPFHSIAAASGTSVPTIKSRFRYGVRKLRNLLSRKGAQS